jgi:para-nitrobenzyl esterase
MATILGPQPRRFTMPGAEPTVDGKSIVQQPYDAVSPDASKDVPLLVGSNFNEFDFDIKTDWTEAQIMEQLAGKMGEEGAKAYADAFRKTWPDAEPYKMLYHESFFRKGAIAHAAAKSRKEGGAKVWLYLFNWWPNVNALGASHGMELPFMFNNVSLQREMTGGEARAYKFQEAVSDAWLSFIKTGDPNTPALPQWEPYNEADAPTMVLDDKSCLVHHLDDALLELTTD